MTQQDAEQRIKELEAKVAAQAAEIEHLRQVESALRETILQAPVPMGVFDADMRFIAFSNTGSYKVVGKDQIVGRTIYEVLPDSTAFREMHQRVLQGNSESGEFSASTLEDGSTLYVRWSAYPWYEANGEVGGLIIYTPVISAQEALIAQQQQAIAELSSPILPIAERVIIVPLIGAIDVTRAQNILRALLNGISRNRAKVVIIDITGVDLIDSEVAIYINRAIQAARLKGATTILTGVSDSVAETIIDLGIDWSGIETVSDLQSGIAAAEKYVQLSNHAHQVKQNGTYDH